MFEPSFRADYENAPTKIQKRVDNIFRILHDHGTLPKGVREHSSATSDLWLADVTVTGGAWRLVYWKDSNLLTFVRLLNHKDYIRFLRGI